MAASAHEARRDYGQVIVFIRGITHTDTSKTSGYHTRMLGVSHTLLRGITHKRSGYHTQGLRDITHDFEIKIYIDQ